MIIKEFIKEWWDEFKEDLLFNITMSMLCTILFISTIVMPVWCIKSVIHPTKEPEEKTLSIEELLKYCPNVHEKLEELMGGDITPTEEGKKWIDNICEVANGD